MIVGDLKLTSEADEYISKASQPEIFFQKCDVSEWDDLHSLISMSVDKFGSVCTAGMAYQATTRRCANFIPEQ